MPAESVPAPHAEIAVSSDDGMVLAVRRHGNLQATTRLFVSHGNGFAIDGYVDFWSRFLRDFEIVAFDMRSHGRNPLADPANHDYAHMQRDVAAVCRAAADEFGPKPSAGLFHSMSAQSALLQALAGMPPCDALILFDPPNVPEPGHAVREAMLGYEHKLARWAEGRREHFADPEELAADYARTRTGRRWPDGTASLMAHAVLQARSDGSWSLACPRELEASMYLQGIDLGLWPRRIDVALPVALIGADPDCAYPAPTGLSNRALAQENGFEYRAIPGTSHLLQLEEPAACAVAARDLLAKFGLH